MLSQAKSAPALREREFAGACGTSGAEHSSDKKQNMLKYNAECLLSGCREGGCP